MDASASCEVFQGVAALGIVCSWAGADGLKANAAPAVAEADRAPAFTANVGDFAAARWILGWEVGQSPVAACGHSLWHFEVKSWWIRASKKKASGVPGAVPSSSANPRHPCSHFVRGSFSPSSMRLGAPPSPQSLPGPRETFWGARAGSTGLGREARVGPACHHA